MLITNSYIVTFSNFPTDRQNSRDFGKSSTQIQGKAESNISPMSDFVKENY
jgi:hypothetical protein